jgi:hypothetical protein
MNCLALEIVYFLLFFDIFLVGYRYRFDSAKEEGKNKKEKRGKKQGGRESRVGGK